jgi:hypothetical protein
LPILDFGLSFEEMVNSKSAIQIPKLVGA